MPLAFTGFIYLLLSKNFKTTTILVIIAIIGIVGAFFWVLSIGGHYGRSNVYLYK